MLRREAWCAACAKTTPHHCGDPALAVDPDDKDGRLFTDLVLTFFTGGLWFVVVTAREIVRRLRATWTCAECGRAA